MYGSIEAGGTKFVCAVGNNKFDILEKETIFTEEPNTTLKKVFDFFDCYNKVESIGVGSFGPIDIKKDSSTYGYIKNTPKPLWQNFNFLEPLRKRYNIPVGWTTDVNIAALGEATAGAGKNMNNVLYITIGTGVGGGAIINGKILEGFGHPEMGHIKVHPHSLDNFTSICPYHSNCLEGLASGPTLEEREGKNREDIKVNDSVWDFIAYYLAQAIYNYTMVLSPNIIILGGGVMNNAHLLPKIKEELLKIIDNYIKIPPLDDYLVTPKLKNNAGIIGGLILAEKQQQNNKF